MSLVGSINPFNLPTSFLQDLALVAVNCPRCLLTVSTAVLLSSTAGTEGEGSTRQSLMTIVTYCALWLRLLCLQVTLIQARAGYSFGIELDDGSLADLCNVSELQELIVAISLECSLILKPQYSSCICSGTEVVREVVILFRAQQCIYREKLLGSIVGQEMDYYPSFFVVCPDVFVLVG